ncbi:MAG: porin family protein [Candidatus Cyclobacteriaceae bacterium M3_2C_046]
MKRSLAIIAVFCSFAISLSGLAQQLPNIGLKAGLNLSHLAAGGVNRESMGFGVHAGVVSRFEMNDFFAIQPEILFTQKGASVDIPAINQEIELNLNYVEVPIMAVLNLADLINLQAGVYGAYMVGANIDFSGNLSNNTQGLDIDNFNSFDLGLAGGLGIKLNQIVLGARYSHGLIGVGDYGFLEALSGLKSAKNRVFQLYTVIGL